MRRTSRPGGAGPASSGSANAPARPTPAPITTSAGECAPSARRETPMTNAASAATGSTAERRRNSSAARPPATTAAAATWPLGVRISVVPRLAEQARNTSLSASIAANVATMTSRPGAGAAPPALREQCDADASDERQDDSLVGEIGEEGHGRQTTS